ncbi:MAG: nucleotidyltransferase family protein [Calditrichaceae bacterium]|nr:nucleotidyltransferase family protein [Calditrichaceae bacterium]
MKTQQEIIQRLANLKNHLKRKYPIKSVAIFGSYARNEQNDTSDLDIMIEFSGNIGIKFIDLADELDKDIGVKVDLVSRNGIKDRYYEVIESELIYV